MLVLIDRHETLIGGLSTPISPSLCWLVPLAGVREKSAFFPPGPLGLLLLNQLRTPYIIQEENFIMNINKL